MPAQRCPDLYRPVEIQQTFPLAETSAALATFMAGTLGKLVITVG